MNNILIVVDVQNGFIRNQSTNDVSKRIIELTSYGYFDTIFATRFINKEGSQYTRMLNWHRLISSPDIDLVEGIHADIIIDKLIYTCVNQSFITTLSEINNGQCPSHIFICGIDTDCCVLKIASDLFEQGIMPIVLSDYCSSNGGEESHEAGLLVLSRTTGRKSVVAGKIVSREQLVEIVRDREY
jgi:nicotinamidase-related amidase